MTTSGDHSYNCGANAAIVGECSCSLSTPTPGDLSARHWDAIRALLTDYRAALGIIAKHEGPVASKISKEAEEAITALSALPAAGEPVAWLVEKTGKSSWSGKVETRRDAILGSPESYREEGFTCRPLVFGDTTPQPSAAEELGPHPLNTCPKCKDYYMECECPADPAVGAQGGDWQDKVLEILRPLLDTGDSRTADDKAVAIYAILADAAPAAGKGEDDVLDLATQYGDHSVDSRNRESWDFDAHGLKQLAAALTRQPVAGDGNSEVRLFDGQWVNIVNHDNCYRDYTIEDAVAKAVRMTEAAIAENVALGRLPKRRHAAPAATPTDGGEG